MSGGQQHKTVNQYVFPFSRIWTTEQFFHNNPFRFRQKTRVLNFICSQKGPESVNCSRQKPKPFLSKSSRWKWQITHLSFVVHIYTLFFFKGRGKKRQDPLMFSRKIIQLLSKQCNSVSDYSSWNICIHCQSQALWGLWKPKIKR